MKRLKELLTDWDIIESVAIIILVILCGGFFMFTIYTMSLD